MADLKVRFPSLQEGMKGLLSSEMEKVVREEKFLKEEPERLESALRRCKKLTGTLVTLKRYGFLFYWNDIAGRFQLSKTVGVLRMRITREHFLPYVSFAGNSDRKMAQPIKCCAFKFP